MDLLRDSELLANIEVQTPAAAYIEDLELPDDPYSSLSPVQASSVDLHIGNVYLPGKEDNDNGGAQNPMLDHELLTGETAVITTKEKLHLPNDVAAFGFPPSRVSFKGLLMTNPGHVDPGYDGVMRFTVINMAQKKYRLTRGEPIVTLLLFKMDKPAHSGWRERNPAGSELPTQSAINRLSKDFVDVEKRAQHIARVQGAKVSSYIAGGLTLLTAVVGLASSGHFFHNAAIEDLTKRQELVEYDLKNRLDVDRRLQEFDSRLKDLERSRPSTPSNPNPKPSGNK